MYFKMLAVKMKTVKQKIENYSMSPFFYIFNLHCTVFIISVESTAHYSLHTSTFKRATLLFLLKWFFGLVIFTLLTLLFVRESNGSFT